LSTLNDRTINGQTTFHGEGLELAVSAEKLPAPELAATIAGSRRSVS